MGFQVGNNYGKTTSRKGVPNQVKKADCVKLVNMLLEDFTTNYNSLNVYQRIKLFGFMKDILRDTMTPIDDQASEQRIFEIKIINGDESTSTI